MAYDTETLYRELTTPSAHDEALREDVARGLSHELLVRFFGNACADVVTRGDSELSRTTPPRETLRAELIRRLYRGGSR